MREHRGITSVVSPWCSVGPPHQGITPFVVHLYLYLMYLLKVSQILYCTFRHYCEYGDNIDVNYNGLMIGGFELAFFAARQPRQSSDYVNRS